MFIKYIDRCVNADFFRFVNTNRWKHDILQTYL